MYSKFNCTITKHFYHEVINQHCDNGRKLYEKYQQQSEDCLKNFLLNNGHIDGSALKSHWFGIEKVDVFISHSHKDLEEVKAFAGWLSTQFKLNVFVDSCAWGYCNSLLRQIDDKYCKHEDGKTYDYQLRNYTTSHVHAMLSSALVEMIDKTECVLFYNTPKSICLEDELDDVKKRYKTFSPWIYHELSTASTIMPRTPERKQPMQESFEQRTLESVTDSASLMVDYDIDSFIKDMYELNDDLLSEWQNMYQGNKHALDVLYELVGTNK